MKFEGYAVRGLLSMLLSHGMENLTAEVNAHWPGTMQVSDHGWAIAWFSNVPWLTEQAKRIKKSGKKLVLAGHSFGGTAIIVVAQNLAREKIEVDLLCPIDPAYQYTTVIPPTVKRLVGFYQRTPGELGQGVDVEGKGWDDAKWKEQVDYRRYETHLQIAVDPFVHKTIINEIRKIAA